MALKNKTENVVCDNCAGSGGPVLKASPRGETMRSDCNKIGTWNVLSLNMPGKLANVLKEMKRMGVGIMGVAEIFWDKEGDFPTQLPESDGGDKYHVFYSGGKRKRRGVGVIVREEVVKSVMMWEPISERIMIMKLKVAPINMLIVQIYAPCEDDKEEEKDRFYERLDQVVADYSKGRECMVVMGDFNGKVGDSKEVDTVGPFGLGERNDNGERVVEFCKRYNLFATNTWFQQKRSAQWTWKSPGEVDPVKNQIDYVLLNKRVRNCIQNSKSRPGADCVSDHNPAIITIMPSITLVRTRRKTAPSPINKSRQFRA